MATDKPIRVGIIQTSDGNLRVEASAFLHQQRGCVAPRLHVVMAQGAYSLELAGLGQREQCLSARPEVLFLQEIGYDGSNGNAAQGIKGVVQVGTQQSGGTVGGTPGSHNQLDDPEAAKDHWIVEPLAYRCPSLPHLSGQCVPALRVKADRQVAEKELLPAEKECVSEADKGVPACRSCASRCGIPPLRRTMPDRATPATSAKPNGRFSESEVSRLRSSIGLVHDSRAVCIHANEPVARASRNLENGFLQRVAEVWSREKRLRRWSQISFGSHRVGQPSHTQNWCQLEIRSLWGASRGKISQQRGTSSRDQTFRASHAFWPASRRSQILRALVPSI